MLKKNEEENTEMRAETESRRVKKREEVKNGRTIVSVIDHYHVKEFNIALASIAMIVLMFIVGRGASIQELEEAMS